jgi:hypothetical protein
MVTAMVVKVAKPVKKPETIRPLQASLFSDSGGALEGRLVSLIVTRR